MIESEFIENEKGEKKNIKRLKNLSRTDRKSRKELKKENKKLQNKLARSSRTDKGIDTMLKITSYNHVALSGMADNKSNIMISINTIILSVIVSMLFGKIGSIHPY
jgi:hypothetical protein